MNFYENHEFCFVILGHR